MNASGPAHPGVPFPPPLLFVLGLLGGLLLHRAVPVALVPGGPAPVGVAAAWALVGAGVVLLAWAMGTFARARTAIIPNQPASQVVSRGPYRFSRNPMYVALTAMYLGLALWRNTLWPLLLLPAVLWMLQAYVIRREERYLAHAFGDAYDHYRARVRRWL